MSQRVFVSSVMKGYSEHRQAARSAVELLRHQPVMAEDFGAKPNSPQNACLKGVRESDLLILILGQKYGFIAASGKSATEEEFLQARVLGIPVLVFIEECSQEPAQDAFVKRVCSYETGYFVAKFATPQELKDLIIRSVNDAASAKNTNSLDPSEAKQFISSIVSSPSDNGSGHIPLIRSALIPAFRNKFISLQKLADSKFRNSIQREAVYGDFPIFNSELGTKVYESENGIIFEQGKDQRPRTALEVWSDGTLVFTKAMVSDHLPANSTLLGMIIDEDDFRVSLSHYFRNANKLYGLLEDSRDLGKFYFGGVFEGVSSRVFGRRPKSVLNSISIGGGFLSDPLEFCKDPYLMSRAALATGEEAATEITEMVARKFRLSRAYFPPEIQ